MESHAFTSHSARPTLNILLPFVTATWHASGIPVVDRDTCALNQPSVCSRQLGYSVYLMCQVPYSSPNIIQVIKSRREMGRACRMYGVKDRCIRGFGQET